MTKGVSKKHSNNSQRINHIHFGHFTHNISEIAMKYPEHFYPYGISALYVDDFLFYFCQFISIWFFSSNVHVLWCAVTIIASRGS